MLGPMDQPNQPDESSPATYSPPAEGPIMRVSLRTPAQESVGTLIYNAGGIWWSPASPAMASNDSQAHAGEIVEILSQYFAEGESVDAVVAEIKRAYVGDFDEFGGAEWTNDDEPDLDVDEPRGADVRRDDLTPAGPTHQELDEYRSRVRGCLLGGAIGDALGGPVEFWKLERITREVGEEGVREFLHENSAGERVYGRITDDTQMTLFTVEGMIRASVRAACHGLGFTVGVIHHAYDRWLDTQYLDGPSGERDGWLIGEQWLYAQRAPGNTCLSALERARLGGPKIEHLGSAAENNSKGCGGVRRSAPIGLFPPWEQWVTDHDVFDIAAEAAGYTHGHPTGQLASGAFAVLIRALLRGESLNAAVDAMLAELRSRRGHEETSAKIELASRWADGGAGKTSLIETLGGGWVAEEALAIAVYAAKSHQEPDQVLDALAFAVTHSGDSDSTGAICGNILGAMHGEASLPPELLFKVEGRAAIAELADDFVLEFTQGDRLRGPHGPNTGWFERYPGW